MSEILKGKVVGWDSDGINIRVPYTTTFRAERRQYEDVTVEFHDGRKRSLDQNKKAWALMSEIGEWMGVHSYAVEQDVYYPLREMFTMNVWESIQQRMFKLSKADVTTARMFINFLIDFILDNGVPTKQPLYEHADDMPYYVYSCLMHKRCCICGKPCDLHHVDRVGMGNDRTKINHIGLRCLPLCREHHQEAHQHGDKVLMDKYHLEAVRIDDDIAKTYKLNMKERR